MSGRFTNLPDRLRECAEMVAYGGTLELGDSMAMSAMMRDAALKIEALERELKNPPAD